LPTAYRLHHPTHGSLTERPPERFRGVEPVSG
jgi:hypothetical protein